MATYYVSLSGSNANNGTSISTPKRNFANAIALLAPGDTLYVRGGTWTEQMNFMTPNISGSVGQYITVSGYPGETVLIKYPEIVNGNGYGPIRARGNRGYFIFQDLILDGGDSSNDSRGGWALRDGNHHFTLRRLEIRNFKNVSALYISANDITIEDCILHDQFSTLLTTGTFHYGIYFHDGARVVIDGVEMYNNVGGGMQLYPGPISDSIVRNCRIHDNNQRSHIHIGGIQIYSAGNAISNTSIYNNIIYRNGTHAQAGVSPGLEIEQATTTGVKAYNNTIYANKNEGLKVSAAVNSVIRNNIIYANLGTAIINSGTGTILSNNITANPEFVDAANNDFHIKSTSVARDAGTTVAEVTEDIEGNARPQGASYDVGAYEYTESGPVNLDAYYVSTTGNDNNTGTISSPFATIAKGLQSLTPGDTLYLRAGTHTMSAEYGTQASHTFGGESASWDSATSIRNYPGETVTVKTLGINMDDSLATGGIGYLIWEADVAGRLIIEQSGSGTSTYGFRVNNAAHHIRFNRLLIRNFNGYPLFGGSGTLVPDSIEITNCEIRNSGTLNDRPGISASRSSNWLIENNLVIGNRGHGISLYNSVAGSHANATIRYNRVEGRNSGTATTGYAIRLGSGSGHKIHKNVLIAQGSQAAGFNSGVWIGEAGITGVQIYNNTLHGFTTGVEVLSPAAGTLLKNNIYSSVTTRLSNTGTGTLSTTEFTGTASFTTPGSVFTLNTGSSAINSGTSTGLSFAGVNPDAGAYESPVYVSASVLDGTPAHVIVNMDAVSDLRPTSGITGFTVRVDGVTNTITSATANGKVITLVVTTPVEGGDVVTLSYSGGNLTDSSPIGNTTYQPFAFALTNTAVINNVVTPPDVPSPITGLAVRRI